MKVETMKIESDTLSVLENCTVQDSLLFLPNVQLERSLYLKVNKVLESLGGKWNRKQKAHIFESNPSDVLDSCILTGEYTSLYKELQFFPTPNSIITQMLEYIPAKSRVLEPSAGKGAIVKRLIEHGCIVLCCEKHEPFREELKKTRDALILDNPDFLTIDPSNINIDAIVANPPFTKQQDVEHVSHMLKFSTKTIISVMSAGIKFRTNSKTDNLKNELSTRNYEIIDLPEQAFKSSGTAVNTVLLIVR